MRARRAATLASTKRRPPSPFRIREVHSGALKRLSPSLRFRATAPQRGRSGLLHYPLHARTSAEVFHLRCPVPSGKQIRIEGTGGHLGGCSKRRLQGGPVELRPFNRFYAKDCGIGEAVTPNRDVGDRRKSPRAEGSRSDCGTVTGARGKVLALTAGSAQGVAAPVFVRR
jgi:hypothetical protein